MTRPRLRGPKVGRPVGPGSRSRWLLLGSLVLGIVGLSALWYATRGALGPETPAHGGRYVEAVVGAPYRVNPLYTSFNEVDKDLAALVFAGLTRLGPDGTVLPDLAESWEVSSDARVYTFHLRRDVTWHDGAAFSADDVLFTWSALRDPDFKGEPSLGQFWQRVECAKLDDFNVRCELPQPFAPFPAYATIGILPRHRLEGLSADSLSISPFNEQPIGTGPFILRELDSQRALLESNPSYYLGEPLIEELELRFFPDYASAVTALREKRVQGLLLGPEASAEDLAQLEELRDMRQLTSRRNSYTILYLNTRLPLLEDKWVRQAILYALDREAIVTNTLDGRAQLANSPIVPGTWAYSDDVSSNRHDPEQARSLLEKRGWQMNSRGVMEKEGTELHLAILTDSDPERIAIAQEIGRQLKEVGVEVSVESQGGSALVQDFILPRRFEAVLYGWDQGYDPDPYPAWHSSQAGGQGLNLAGFSHQYLDQVLSEARQSSDLERRKALYREFQQIFAQEVPSVLLFYPVYNYFIDQRVRGVSLGVLFEPASRFVNVHQWYVKTKHLGL
ncbi:MAG: ABC transporter substrate-binding protein [Chloroflexota bacterium]|nr:ABC transporter substrate-binding protein [Chloroflexota bacterium]